MPERNPYAPPTANLTAARSAVFEGERLETPPFFATSIIKLSVMSVCTFGLYELYWFYRNWQLIKARERLNIMPFWRAFFGVFFCYQCFSRIREYDHPELAVSSFAAGPLAAGWIVFTVLWRLPDPYWLICDLSFVFLIPVQHHANQINNAVAPGHDPNARFTWLNWISIAIGCLLLVLNVIGFLN